jgi:four helix bundle protein
VRKSRGPGFRFRGLGSGVRGSEVPGSSRLRIAVMLSTQALERSGSPNLGDSSTKAGRLADHFRDPAAATGTRSAPRCLMAGVRDHSELDAWKLCAELCDRVHVITARPAFRDFSLKDQLNKAVESPCPNIGEGFSRYYPLENAKFVRVAKGSLTEVIEHMRNVRNKGFATAQEYDEICLLARRARGAVTGYVRYLESAPEPRPPGSSRRRRRR